SGHAPDCYQDGQAVPDFSRWPLQSHLILGALPSAVPCARLHTRHMLWEWGLQPLTDQAELIVSDPASCRSTLVSWARDQAKPQVAGYLVTAGTCASLMTSGSKTPRPGSCGCLRRG